MSETTLQIRQAARKRVNEIDLLRFLAALSVLFFHYTFRGYAEGGMSLVSYPSFAPFTKYGYLGVQLFFMISGFVILMTASGGSLRSFVVSRLVRLYPAFWACCTITFAAILVFGEPRFTASMDQYLTNMSMLSGFVGVPSIDGSYWSLFVELKFYALVSVVLAIRRIHQTQIFLIIWLVSSIVLEMLPVDKLRYFLLVDYSSYFIAGAMYFLVWSKGLSLTRVGVIVSSWGLAIYQSVKNLPRLEEFYSTTMSHYVVVGIITSIFLVMFLVSIQRTGFIGRNRWLMAGVLTYPLYLLHQYVGFMVFNVANSAINKYLLLWGTIIFMLGAAYAVNILVERRLALPMKNALNRSLDSLHRLKMRVTDTNNSVR